MDLCQLPALFRICASGRTLLNRTRALSELTHRDLLFTYADADSRFLEDNFMRSWSPQLDMGKILTKLPVVLSRLPVVSMVLSCTAPTLKQFVATAAGDACAVHEWFSIPPRHEQAQTLVIDKLGQLSDKAFVVALLVLHARRAELLTQFLQHHGKLLANSRATLEELHQADDGEYSKFTPFMETIANAIPTEVLQSERRKAGEMYIDVKPPAWVYRILRSDSLPASSHKVLLFARFVFCVLFSPRYREKLFYMRHDTAQQKQVLADFQKSDVAQAMLEPSFGKVMKCVTIEDLAFWACVAKPARLLQDDPARAVHKRQQPSGACFVGAISSIESSSSQGQMEFGTSEMLIMCLSLKRPTALNQSGTGREVNLVPNIVHHGAAAHKQLHTSTHMPHSAVHTGQVQTVTITLDRDSSRALVGRLLPGLKELSLRGCPECAPDHDTAQFLLGAALMSRLESHSTKQLGHNLSIPLTDADNRFISLAAGKVVRVTDFPACGAHNLWIAGAQHYDSKINSLIVHVRSENYIGCDGTTPSDKSFLFVQVAVDGMPKTSFATYARPAESGSGNAYGAILLPPMGAARTEPFHPELDAATALKLCLCDNPLSTLHVLHITCRLSINPYHEQYQDL